MELIKTDILDVYILKPKLFNDARGWFMESWSKQEFDKLGLKYNFIQDNRSFSKEKGIIRGLHLQKGEYSQAKLVSCLKGKVLDVAVDLRKNSDTYLKHVAVELSEENKLQLLIPRGFAHGFLTMSENVEFFYKVDNVYAPLSEQGIIWNDDTFNINWSITKPILSEKDKVSPSFIECNIDF